MIKLICSANPPSFKVVGINNFFIFFIIFIKANYQEYFMTKKLVDQINKQNELIRKLQYGAVKSSTNYTKYLYKMEK